MPGSPLRRARREEAERAKVLDAERRAREAAARAEWKPFPGPQTAFMTCPVEDILFGGSRGGGKTLGIIGDWIRHQNDNGEHARGLLLRRTYRQLMEEVQIPHLLPLFTRIGAKFTEPRWTMANGATLTLGYLANDQDAEQFQGSERTWVGVDESGNFPDSLAIDRVRGAMRSAHGIGCQMRMTGNPGGPGQAWLKARYIDPSPPGVPFVDPESGIQRVFIPSKLSDNPVLMADPSYMVRLRASGPPWLVDAWLNGNWNASVEGGWVQPEWLAKRYSVEPEMAARGCSAIVLSVDTAAKDKASSCYSVCLAWGVADNHFYLLDVWRQKALFPELRRGIMGMRDKWKPVAVLIEDKSTGQALIPELRVDRRWGSTPIIPVCPKPGDDKQTRFNRNLPFFESQLVILPMSSAWSLDYESEIKLFPLGANNDQVDATSQFLDWYTENQRYVAPRTGTFRQNYMAR